METKNTYITYSKLLSLLHPYFLMYGGEDFMSPNELSIMINMAIQDLYNNSTFSFLAEFQKIQAEEELYEGTYSIFKTKYPISLIHELLINGEGDDMTEQIVNTMPHTNKIEFYFKKGTNIIYGHKDIKTLTINYNKEYEINDLVTDEDKKKELPIPFSFIPALVKMIYDTASPYTFFQGDGSSTDYYSQGKIRMNDLVQNDILTSNSSLNIGEQ